MDTNIITWIFFGILGLFIFFKFRKFLPFKQDARRVNYYHTENHPVPKQNVIKKIRSETRYDVNPVNDIVEPVVNDEIEPVVNDEFADVASENADLGKKMFGTYDYESESDDTDYQKIWEDTANENEKFVNDMFGFDGNTKSKKKRSKKDEDYW
tara:strand:- start:682 stop:1143 length:462 start_codon:yes stop_codon:yes gene_type:complete